MARSLARFVLLASLAAPPAARASEAVPPGRSEPASAPPALIVDALAYEHRFDSGLALGFALGPMLGLGGGRICDYLDGCAESDLHDVAGVWKGQARLQLAYWF